MQTEPEQWAVELWTEARRRHEMAKRSLEFSNRELEGIAALTIQRAFEERERKLREAVSAAQLFACCFLAFLGRDRGTDRQDGMLDDMCREASGLDDKLRQALATRQDAPKACSEDTSHDH